MSERQECRSEHRKSECEAVSPLSPITRFQSCKEMQRRCVCVCDVWFPSCPFWSLSDLFLLQAQLLSEASSQEDSLRKVPDQSLLSHSSDCQRIC